jgi:hypothetical protein
MVKTNILELLTSLNAAGVRVNLLNNYDPATYTSKAGEDKQSVRFKQDTPYYKLPKYEISSAGNLNVSFVLKGKATDLTTGKSYDAINFKCISFVKNQQLFKKTLDICPEDAGIVRDLGYDIKDNIIDLTQYSLTDGIDVDWYDFADACVERYIYEALRERTHKTHDLTPRTLDEERLLKEGFDTRTGVWSPIVTGTLIRVKNVNTDYIGFGNVNGYKCIPRIADILTQIENRVKLSDASKAIYELYKQGYEIQDANQKVNACKYNMLINRVTVPSSTFYIFRNGIKFEVRFK